MHLYRFYVLHIRDYILDGKLFYMYCISDRLSIDGLPFFVYCITFFPQTNN